MLCVYIFTTYKYACLPMHTHTTTNPHPPHTHAHVHTYIHTHNIIGMQRRELICLDAQTALLVNHVFQTGDRLLPRRWKVFFGVIINMGLIQLSNLEAYWKTSWTANIPFFGFPAIASRRYFRCFMSAEKTQPIKGKKSTRSKIYLTFSSLIFSGPSTQIAIFRWMKLAPVL